MPIDNGGMTFYPTASADTTTTRYVSRPSGLTMSQIGDGTSKTILLAESKERGYSAWIDGSSSWVVAYDPNQTTDPVYSNGKWLQGSGGSSIVFKGIGYAASISSSGTTRYMPAANFQAGSTNRYAIGMAWGPSSDHAGGQVIHTFADGHTSSFTDDIDGTFYLSLTSRNSGEPISGDY